MKLPSKDDLNDRAKKFAEEGKTLFQSAIGKLDLFSSAKAYESEKSQERIESHYVLVPFKKSNSGFALYTMRTVPKDWQRVSELPEKRIFHFAKPEHRDVLDQLVFENRSEANNSENGLEALAKEIDSKSSALTQSMVVIGSAVLFLNPLVGGIVLLSSIVPYFGSSIINKGIQTAGDKLSNWKNRKEAKSTKSEIKKMKPEVCINPLLSLALDTFHPDQSANFAPIEDDRNRPEDLDIIIAFRVVATAISDIYSPYLKKKRSWSEVGLNANSAEWVETLKAFTETTD